MSAGPSNGRVLGVAAPALLTEITRPWAPARGDDVVVAVSGGADSTSLLHLLAALAPGRGWRLVVATLDHGLRDPDSREDRRFVERLSARLGLECVSDRRNVQRASGSPNEERARDARREFLMEVARSTGASAIALAHTAEDQAETVLHRLGRGTGLRGLGGMRRWSPPLWRPLLGVRREDARGVLVSAGLSWREDPSNSRLDATRNRIRHLVLPSLDRALGRGSVDAVARVAKLARDDEAFLTTLADEKRALVERSRSSREVVIDRRALAATPAPLARRIVRDELNAICGGRRLAAHHVLSVLELAVARSHGTHIDLPGGASADRRGDTIVLARPLSPDGAGPAP